MRFSFGLPTCMEGMMYPVPFATVDQLVELAIHAENLGYHSLWGNDHMTTQRYVREEYSIAPNFWEILVTLSFISAETKHIKIATGILVMAMRRDIVVLAKQLATLDQFSSGRLLLGLGVGAYREEFEALHPDLKVHRGNLLEEGIQALQHLFNKRITSWKGEYFHFEDVEMYPKPAQTPIPIYVGGNNQNAVRRSAIYGQGWMGAGMPVDQMSKSISNLFKIAEENGRDPSKIDIAPQFVASVASNHERAIRIFRNSQMYAHLVSLSSTTLKDQVEAGSKFEDVDLIGNADSIIEKVEAYREIGVTHISGILFPANSIEEMRDQMQQFSEEIIQKTKS
jgi:probable F420-dependent oxidoreductase